MILTQIQLTKDQSKSLKKIALQDKESVAEIIRQGIDYYIRSKSTISFEERKQQALSIVGKFKSREKDLSSEHDDYFVESIDT